MFNQIRDKILERFKALSKKMKITLAASAAVFVILLTVVILLVTRTKYVTIASGMDPADTKAVTDKLTAIGVKWKDDISATTVSVAKRDVSKARMELAATVGAGSISWSDVFKNDSITMTSNTRSQMYVQAQATAIKESIETIDGIRGAQVILQLPKDSNYFINRKAPAKASVALQLKPGFSLPPDVVNGIVALITSSAKDLSAENITIIDQTGRQLNNPNLLDDFSVSSQYEMTVKYKKKTEEDLASFLANIYGPTNVDVQASVKLNFDKDKVEIEKFSPPIEGETTGLVRSMTKIVENVNTEGAIGAPGTDSNTGEATSVTEDGDKGRYQKVSETLNHELNRTYRTLEKAGGQVESLKIAVLINETVLKDNELSPEHMAELKSLISNAVSTETENISVVLAEFPDLSAQYDLYTGEEKGATIFGISIILVLIIVIVIAVVAIVLISLKRKKDIREMEEEKQAAIEEIEDEFDEIGDLDEKGSPKYHIERFIDKNPEAAATLLRAWLNE